MIPTAPTQVMSGLVGAILHPEPRSALVIGLGTGSSAGWLAAVDGMRAVDVVELEPAIRRVAEECSPVNRDVLARRSVRLVIADGREYLLTADRRWDLIFSEPSNPYRAGIASLFTREFYRQVRERLAPDGVFCTQVSGASHYLGRAVGSYTGSVFRTLSEVFSEIAIAPGDVQVFCASTAPIFSSTSSGRVSGARRMTASAPSTWFTPSAMASATRDGTARYAAGMASSPAS